VGTFEGGSQGLDFLAMLLLEASDLAGQGHDHRVVGVDGGVLGLGWAGSGA